MDKDLSSWLENSNNKKRTRFILLKWKNEIIEVYYEGYSKHTIWSNLKEKNIINISYARFIELWRDIMPKETTRKKNKNKLKIDEKKLQHNISKEISSITVEQDLDKIIGIDENENKTNINTEDEFIELPNGRKIPNPKFKR